jgi:FkbM family methyltransferase
MGFGISGKLANLYCEFVQPRTAVSVDHVTNTFVTDTPQLRRRAMKLGGERNQLTAFVRELREGDVVWDVGSFVGLYALFAAKTVGPTGAVYAFEPEPDSMDMLRQNCKLSGVTNVTTVAGALSDADENGFIYPAKPDANAIHSLKPGGSLSAEGRPISLWRGDTLVSESRARAPQVVKIDVEGAEMLVLQGLQKTLAESDCRFLCIELHHHDLPKFGAQPDDVLDFLRTSGFGVEQLFQRGTESHLFCHRAR